MWIINCSSYGYREMGSQTGETALQKASEGLHSTELG